MSRTERLTGRAGGRRRLGALVAAAAAAAIAPVALAQHFFGDVPEANPHHDDVSAIAGAGITTGCAPGSYCPDQPVRRDQMASFLRRGFGRVGNVATAGATVPAPYGPIGEATITTGVPPGALSGAGGFVKVDGYVVLTVADPWNCPCTISVYPAVDGQLAAFWTSRAVIDTNGFTTTLPLAGAARVTGSGVKTVEVFAGQFSGTATVTARAQVVASYFPFGSTGAGTLGAAAPAGEGGAEPGAVALRP